jgi:hypothetical protein
MITSAVFTQPDNSRALVVYEDGRMIECGFGGSAWAELQVWAESNAIGAFVPAPQPVHGPHKVYQQTLWSRTTEAEAVALKAALDQAEIKFQMLFNSSDFFLSNHPMFALLHWTLALALAIEGEPNVARADELLEVASAEEAAALAPETA